MQPIVCGIQFDIDTLGRIERDHVANDPRSRGHRNPIEVGDRELVAMGMNRNGLVAAVEHAQFHFLLGAHHDQGLPHGIGE